MRFGWKPDAPDERDLVCGIHWPWQKREPLPELGELPAAFLSRIEDQQDLGSCTAHAVTSCLEFLFRKAGLEQPELSRLFVYYASRVGIERSPPTFDSGCSLRDVIKALAAYGACLEDLWPYEVSRFADMPSDAAWKDASQRKVLKYARCSTLEDIKHSIVEGYPVALGFMFPRAGMTDACARTGVLPEPVAGEEIAGGHAVYAASYDDATGLLGCVNSYGLDWGREGRPGWIQIPYARIPSGLDAWTIRTQEGI